MNAFNKKLLDQFEFFDIKNNINIINELCIDKKFIEVKNLPWYELQKYKLITFFALREILLGNKVAYIGNIFDMYTAITLVLSKSGREDLIDFCKSKILSYTYDNDIIGLTSDIVIFDCIDSNIINIKMQNIIAQSFSIEKKILIYDYDQ